MNAHVLLNVTTNDDEPGPDVLVIFTRFDSPRARAGDTLRYVASFDVDALDSLQACEELFAIGNGVRPESDDYYAHDVRSLSCGDVVVVETGDGRAAYSCEASGWASVDLTEFNIEGWES